MKTPKGHFEINWPLGATKNLNHKTITQKKKTSIILANEGKNIHMRKWAREINQVYEHVCEQIPGSGVFTNNPTIPM